MSHHFYRPVALLLICLCASLLILAFLISSSHAVFLGSTTIVIDAVLYDGSINDNEEAVRLRNISQFDIDLGDWSLFDGARQSTLPVTLTIGAGEYLWIAKDSAAFAAQFGFPPDVEPSTWLGLTNTGDELFLRDANGTVIDVLIYENGNTSAAGSDWQGTAVQPYTKLSSGVDGQILFRKLDPTTGLPVADTNSAADWGQDPNDVLNGRRVLYPGWDYDDFFLPAMMNDTAVLTIAVAPDNGYETLVHQINRAQERIRIQTHTFENIAIGHALVAASQRGVSVTILLEGGPPGGISDDQKYICSMLRDAGGRCWFLSHNKSEGYVHRYYFLHAKFMIIDNGVAMVSSENFSPNSLPSDLKTDGTFGRRGVLIFTDSSAVIDHLNRVWEADFDPEHHQDIVLASDDDLALPSYYEPPIQTNPTTYTVRYPDPFVLEDEFEFVVVQSPENSLSQQNTILGLLQEAGDGDTVLVQQLYERPYWGEGNSNAIDDPNIRLTAYLTAARQGARVRLLLDSYFDASNDERSNFATCSTLNALAQAERFDLACQTGNPAGLGIHNKMILADIGGRGYVHIGSLNGSEQSHKGNREIALEFQSDQAYRYLADMFNKDWIDYIYLPLTFNDYKGPADYILISELLYNPFGTDQDEFVELVNPTSRHIDLSGYSLSDAVLITDFADLRRFPQGTTLAPNETLVVAQQATAFEETYGGYPDFEILETTVAVPNLIDDPSWGHPATFLQFGNNGDVITLRNEQNQVVDQIAYGLHEAVEQSTCDLTEIGHSLRRMPYWRDVDECQLDFVAWPVPDPNQLP